VSNFITKHMKMLVVNIPVILVVILAVSCGEKDCCGDSEKENSNELVGEWLLFERGYSPGAGYIIEPVGFRTHRLQILFCEGRCRWVI
jgi:hypothetical protein